MTLRDGLHRLIDLLPESELPRIEGVLAAACAAVVDDRGMTAEDRAWMESDLSNLRGCPQG